MKMMVKMMMYSTDGNSDNVYNSIVDKFSFQWSILSLTGNLLPTRYV